MTGVGANLTPDFWDKEESNDDNNNNNVNKIDL